MNQHPEHPALQTPRPSPVTHRHPLSRDGRQTPNHPTSHAVETETSSVIGRGGQFQDFEKQLQENRAKLRAAALNNADLSVDLDDIDDALPLPDLQQRSIHIPTRTR